MQNKPRYPRWPAFTAAIFVTLLILDFQIINSGVGYLAPIAIVLLFIHQLIVLWPHPTGKKIVQYEALLLIGSAIILFGAASLGTSAGESEFGSEPMFGLTDFLIFGFSVSLVHIIPIYIGNLIYLYSKTNQSIKSVLKVFYGLAWALTLIISFVAFSFIKSLHDPNLE